MKIKTKTLTTFLKKARMGGAQQVIEGIFRFEQDGLKFNTTSDSQQAMSMAWLMKGAFEEYEAIGNVAMNDLQNVTKVLDRFGESITIKKEGNLLNIKGDGKSVDIELVNENFLNTEVKEPALTFDETFAIKSSRLSDVLKDVQMNKDAVLTIKTVEKSVMFTNTGKYKFSNTLDAPMCKGGVKVDFGQPFIDAVEEFDGELMISVKSDHPCKVIEKLETSVITIIVAPRIDSN